MPFALQRLTVRVSVGFAAVALCFSTLSHAQPAPLAATLDQVPAGAEVIFVVPSLSELSDRIAGFAQVTGLDQTSTELANPLAAFKREVRMTEGIDDNGAFVLVVTDLSRSLTLALNEDKTDDIEPTAVMLVPVRDYASYVSQMGGDGAAEITAIEMGNQSGFARKLGGFAVLGETRETVAAYAPAQQGKAITGGVGKLVDRYLTGGDSIVYIDVAAMAPALSQAIDRGEAEMKKQMENEAVQDQPEAYLQMAKALFDLYADYGRTLVAGTDKLVFTLDVTDAGLGLTSATQLVKGSELAKFLTPANQPAAGETSLLSHLPNNSYLYAASIDAQAFGLQDTVDRINKALAGVDLGEMAGFVEMYQQSLATMAQAKSVASVFYTPQMASMMTGGFFKTLTVYDVPDGAAFVAQSKAMIEKVGQVKFAMPLAEEGQPAEEVTFTSSYTPNAMMIEGVQVDQFQFNMNLPPAMMQEMGPMAMMMGSGGYGGYLAQKDNKVLMTTVADAQLIGDGIKALTAGNGIGAAGPIVNLRDAALPPNPSLELYLSFGGLVESVNPFLPMIMPEGQPIEVPANLSPMAFGGTATDDGVAMRMFIPTDLVRFGVDTAAKLSPPQDDAPDGNRRAPRAY